MDASETLQAFCRQARERSRENREALALLHGADLHGNVVGVLRQELDSMVRVIFLLSIEDSARRESLVRDAVNGQTWKSPRKGRVTDREMVELAERLHGWTRSVYRFGCGFIHLSNLHDYRERDPLHDLSEEDKSDILGHLRQYHGGPASESPSFDEVARYLPRVFEKVASNLECYLNQLERGAALELDGA